VLRRARFISPTSAESNKKAIANASFSLPRFWCSWIVRITDSSSSSPLIVKPERGKKKGGAEHAMMVVTSKQRSMTARMVCARATSQRYRIFFIFFRLELNPQKSWSISATQVESEKIHKSGSIHSSVPIGQYIMDDFSASIFPPYRKRP
jgi:hypothetical protein